MKELSKKAGGVCRFCGSQGASLYGGGAELLTRPSPPARLERSGLAYAAGYAGVVYLFGPSFSAFLFELAGVYSTGWALAVTLWGISAPAALALSFVAARSLDRSPEKAGRLPAMFGYLVGMWGTVNFLLTAQSWAHYLAGR